jgi:hypothetical protein
LREIIGEVENPKNNGNYKTAIEARRRKSKAYKANIRRRIRRLICYRRHKNSELGSNGVDNKSNIRNGFKVAARL